MKELSAKYIPAQVEEKWRIFWENKQLYKSVPKKEKNKFSVVIPPPNITGILHIGHILNNTIQDIYCRWKRMQGFEVCWVPGMDHAGIATQIKVEEELRKKGKNKDEIGRDEFVKLVWEWKNKYGGIIFEQLRKLGVSVDWSREKFTLDEDLTIAVKEVFVDLYKKGLIYKGNRIINWDNISQTALSDDEISYIEKKDKLYYIKYYLDNNSDFIIIATTRPETMLGDTAIAVNPNDKRYSNYKGLKAILPLIGRQLAVITDNYVDMEFGTGALKITPAHDLNDFEIGKRHNLDIINVFSKDGHINENGGKYKGLTIKEARNAIIVDLQASGQIIKIEDYIHNVSISERSGAVIEPYLSDQWFVSMKKLSEPAIKVVKEGKIRFHPEKWIKTYYYWLENVKDWCISRQLWWGHQIPIWYNKKTNEIYCETRPPRDIENWTQEEDVLDTWFSSWLWPFSVFGWKNNAEDKNNEDLNFYYPTDFLSTAPEIIFLWVARMIISGLEYRGDIPFRDVYFHSTVRDGIGRKMSKSLGNSPDPLKVMENYGTDALRFTIVYLAPLGSDVLYDEKHTEIGRNFITKLWNAGRFLVLMKNKYETVNSNQTKNINNDFFEKWIDSRFHMTLFEVSNNLNNYRLNDYTKSLYNFVWGDFCDWYIEIIKSKITSNQDTAIALIERALNIYENILKLLHPVIPFSTEEIWHILDEERSNDSISFQTYPEFDESLINTEIVDDMNYFKDLVTTLRNEKKRYDNLAQYKYEVEILPLNNNSRLRLDHFQMAAFSLLAIEARAIIDEPANQSGFSGNFGNFFAVKFRFLNETPKIKNVKSPDDLKREIDNLESYILSLNKKLNNETFLVKAAKTVIDKEKLKLKEAEEKLKKLKNIK